MNFWWHLRMFQVFAIALCGVAAGLNLLVGNYAMVASMIACIAANVAMLWVGRNY